MLPGNGYFVIFLWIYSGESAKVLFPSTGTNIDKEKISSEATV